MILKDLRRRIYTIKHKTKETQSTKDLFTNKLDQLKQINVSISKTVSRYKKMIA